MEKSKRAQANLIVVVLIILISISLIVVVWNAVNPIVKEGEDIEVGALTTNLEIKDVIFFVTGASKITVSRGTGGKEISELKFVFYDESGNSEVYTKEGGLEELGTEVYSFSPIMNLGKIKSVSVYPVLERNVGREFEVKTREICEAPEGLVSWWRFEDNLNDFLENNPGSGTVDFVEGREGRAVSLNGNSISFGSGLGVSEMVAISFWIKTRSDQGSIIKKGDLNKNYEVFLEDGKVAFSYTSEDLKKGVSNNVVNNDEWHHVVVSIDWSGDNYLRIYIDNEVQVIGMEGSPDSNSESVLVGESFSGLIDELMFFNKALSKIEVEGLHNGIC